MICPECTGQMEEIAVGTLVVDVCNQCRGMWFDPDEIETYVRARYSILRGRVADDSDTLGFTGIPTQACPRCRTSKMRLGLFKGLSFEKCVSCGGFFLTKEQIKAVVEEARTPPPPERTLEGGGEVLLEGALGLVVSSLFEFVGGIFSP